MGVGLEAVVWCLQETVSLCPWTLAEILSKASQQPGGLEFVLDLKLCHSSAS